VVESSLFSVAADMSLFVLRHGDNHFGDKKSIHIWLTWNDRANANVMILLSYIMLGHEDWNGAEITVFAAFPKDQIDIQREEMEGLISQGRLPISEKNIQFFATDDEEAFRKLVINKSSDADMAVIGFDQSGLKNRKKEVFLNHSELGCVLFVCASEAIDIE